MIFVFRPFIRLSSSRSKLISCTLTCISWTSVTLGLYPSLLSEEDIFIHILKDFGIALVHSQSLRLV